MFINRGVDKDVVCMYVHTQREKEREREEYYSAIKKNKIMPFTATCMNLEIAKLNEVREKDKYMILLICGI